MELLGIRRSRGMIKSMRGVSSKKDSFHVRIIKGIFGFGIKCVGFLVYFSLER